MNRQNFLGHLALALTLVLLAAFAGQVRHWEREERRTTRAELRAVRHSQETRRKPAEVLVRFRQGTSLDHIKAVAARFNDRVEDQFEYVNGDVAIEDEDGAMAEAVAADYRSLGDEVLYAEPNIEINLEPEFGVNNSYIRREDSEVSDSDEGTNTSNDPNDPQFADQWSLLNTGQNGGKAGADISARDAWHKTKGSEKIVVAVLDTGVDYTHQDLMNNIWHRPDDVAEYTDAQLGTVNDDHGFSAITEDPMDDNGHGTHCAGIIGAEGDNNFGITGVNWHVEIMPLKFMSASGSGTTKDAIECINYVIDRKRAGVNVRIISASWGSTAKSKALEDAISRANEEGILFVAASGNSSADSDKTPHYPAGYELPNIISVAAMDRNDELASFSNYGAKSVHVAAPGKEILSTWLNGAFEEHSGTSMATPVVSGVAALVLATEPNMTVKELRERLLRSVDPLPSLKGKVSTGGRINAAKAVGAK